MQTARDEPDADHDRRQPEHETLDGGGCEEDVHYHWIVPDAPTQDANYSSGDDYVVEFLGYQFSFNATDFEGRVVAAAWKLGLVDRAELEDEEIADLVEVAAQGEIAAPVSRLGRYIVRNWERVSLVEGESLVYWLRKLVFRGAWLDHQVKRGGLEVGLGRRRGRVRLPAPGRRAAAARARSGAVVARAPVQALGVAAGAAYLAALLAVDHFATYPEQLGARRAHVARARRGAHPRSRSSAARRRSASSSSRRSAR